MNRVEFNETLEQLMKDIGDGKGLMTDAGESTLSQADIRYIAAMALMAADRLYSNNTRLEYQRAQNDPFKDKGDA